MDWLSSVVRHVFVWFVLVGSAGGAEITCANYESKLLKQYNEDYHSGKLVSSSEQMHTINWSDLFELGTLDEARRVVCKEKKTNRTGCMSDVFEATVYDNGVVVERGAVYDWYMLHNDFPGSPNGIKPGMSKDEVIAVLGRPRLEMEWRMEYNSSEISEDGIVSPVYLFFDQGKLSFIAHADWKSACVE